MRLALFPQIFPLHLLQSLIHHEDILAANHAIVIHIPKLESRDTPNTHVGTNHNLYNLPIVLHLHVLVGLTVHLEKLVIERAQFSVVVLDRIDIRDEEIFRK